MPANLDPNQRQRQAPGLAVLAILTAMLVQPAAAQDAARAGPPRPLVPPDSLIGTYPVAPPPVPLAPVYGPLATTGTAAPGAPTGGIAPELYRGTGRPLPSPQDIADNLPTDANAAIGQPKRRPPPPTAQSGGSSRLGNQGLDDSPLGSGKSLADCMALWDRSTHMTRDEWRRTCGRTLGLKEDRRRKRR